MLRKHSNLREAGNALVQVIVVLSVGTVLAVALSRFMASNAKGSRSLNETNGLQTLHRYLLNVASERANLTASANAAVNASTGLKNAWEGAAGGSFKTGQRFDFGLFLGNRQLSVLGPTRVGATRAGALCTPPADGLSDKACPYKIHTEMTLHCLTSDSCSAPTGFEVRVSIEDTLGAKAKVPVILTGVTRVDQDTRMADSPCQGQGALLGMNIDSNTNTSTPTCGFPRIYVPSCNADEVPVMQKWPRGDGSLQQGFRCIKIMNAKGGCDAVGGKFTAIKGISLPPPPTPSPGADKYSTGTVATAPSLQPICESQDIVSAPQFSLPNVANIPTPPPAGNFDIICESSCNFPLAAIKAYINSPSECPSGSGCRSLTIACDDGKSNGLTGLSPAAKTNADQMCQVAMNNMRRYDLGGGNLAVYHVIVRDGRAGCSSNNFYANTLTQMCGGRDLAALAKLGWVTIYSKEIGLACVWSDGKSSDTIQSVPRQCK